MTAQDKCNELRSIIETQLLPLINNNYFLLDLPYHANIGDILIWQGELDLLAKCNFKCIGYFSQLTCPKLNVHQGDVIIFHGGGNIGELYREHINYLFFLVEHYPHNRIIVCPQSIYYQTVELFNKDISILLKHKDLHFCCRDERGFQMLNKKLAHVYLLPDMAFCIPISFFESFKRGTIKGSLYLKRIDGEFAPTKFSNSVDYTKDWPTFYHKLNDGLFIAKVLNTLCCKSPIGRNLFKAIWNWYAMHIYRKDLLHIGITFIQKYDPIYTTRLHGMILALLCRKHVTIIDNSYGKNLQFANTWLRDVDNLFIFNE